MEIELPTDDITEVEFEYIKIEKHCFSCFSLFHEEHDCPLRPINSLPPKERKLGITQSIALQRIEAENKRHDDRRGYRRPDDLRSSLRPTEDSFSHSRRDRDRNMNRRHYDRRDEPTREQSILSRTARSNSAYHRSNAPAMQYRVVDRSKASAGSSFPQQNSPFIPEGQDIREVNSERVLPITARVEITPTRNIKERLGTSSAGKDGANSGSKDRRSALERLSDPIASKEAPVRKTPSFDSGRLQLADDGVEDLNPIDQAIMEETNQTERVPATQRLGGSNPGIRSNRGTIPIAAQSKSNTKRKVTRTPIRKRVVRSPLLGVTSKKSNNARSATTTRRRLNVDKDNTVPCNKAGPSNQRKKNGQPTTVFIPGSTRGGVDFRPQQSSLP